MTHGYRIRILPATLFLILVALLIPPNLVRMSATEKKENQPRIDAPFTSTVQTPHVAWGKPSSSGPVRVFAVPSVSEGRTLIELSQRIDMKTDTVMIDDAWDVNTWTVGADDNYEARNYKLAYKYLEEDLTAATPYDLIILPSLFGWNRLPQAVRDSIRKRVEQGAGLVLIHPTTGIPAPDDPKVTGPMNDFAPSREVSLGEDLWELSPLVGVLSDRIDERGFREIRPDATAAGPWKNLSNNFITANVPFETFPTNSLKHYKYRLGKDSAALVTGPDGEPIVATKIFGHGRVVALGYVNAGFSPMIDRKISTERTNPNDRWWEYFYSLLGRSILWAAKREPLMRLGPLTIEPNALKHGEEKQVSIKIENRLPIAAAKLAIVETDEWGKEERSYERSVNLKQGLDELSLPLPPEKFAGRHSVDVILEANGKHYDWGSVTFDIPKSDEILSLSTGKHFYARGDKVNVKWRTKLGTPGRVLVELVDNRERLLGVGSATASRKPSSENNADLPVGNYSTNIGWVRLTLFGGRTGGTIIDRRQVRVNFSSLERDFGAYELIMPWYGPPTYQPWTSTLDEQFRKMGVSVMETPERNFKLIKEVKTPGFGVYWHYRQKYLEQKDKFLDTGDKKYLIREPDLADDAWLEKLRSIIRDDMEGEKSYRPLAYYLADESSLKAYGDPFDLSWSAPTLTKFRAWLKTQYPNLEALNEEWGTQFGSWEEIVPLTSAEAQAKGNYAGWMDHRTFMEQVFARALAVARDTVKQVDASGRPSISGTQAPGPSNAVNWYLLDNIVDYLQPYSEDDQDELHRSTRPGLILTGFTGYAGHGRELRHELWHRLFHGQVGASLFWQYTAVNADLTLTEQGRDLSQTIDEFRNEGLALLLRGAQRDNCGIAVHYSLSSVRGQWITDGHIKAREVSNGDETSAHLTRFHQNRSAWLKALEDAGYQYDFVSTEQVEAGKLAGYRVLILPDSIALSDGEVTAMRKFVSDGGFLIADAETGLMDGHARWQTKGRLDDLLGVARALLRSAPAIVPSARMHVLAGDVGIVLEIHPADPDLRSADGQSLISGGSAQAVDHTYGKGHAVALNFWMTDYPQLRKDGAQWSRLASLHLLLDRAAVRPVADVRAASGKPLACSEVVAYHKQGTTFLAILPEPTCNQDAGAIEVKLATPQYAYDLRAHRFLGRVSRVAGSLIPGEPALYALDSAPMGRLSVSVSGNGKSPAKIKAGDTIRLLVRLKYQTSAAEHARPARHEQGSMMPESAVHVDVRSPSGKTLDYYGTNVPVKGEAEILIPTALNDEAGRWRVTVREPFTHAIATATFQVRR